MPKILSSNLLQALSALCSNVEPQVRFWLGGFVVALAFNFGKILKTLFSMKPTFCSFDILLTLFTAPSLGFC